MIDFGRIRTILRAWPISHEINFLEGSNFSLSLPVSSALTNYGLERDHSSRQADGWS